MSSSLPEGFELRPGRPDDVEPVTELLVAEETALRGASQWGLADTDEWWYGLAGFGEQWIVVDRSRSIAAVLGIFQRGELFNSWIAVDPKYFGRGLDAGLLAHAETQVRAGGGASLNVDTFAENDAAVELFASCGYAEEDRHCRMEVDFVDRPPEPRWPSGVTCMTFEPNADAREFHGTISDAFGHMRMPFDDWLRYHLGAPGFDPTLWFVARDGGTVAGVLRGDENRWGCGWIGMLAVRPRWQGGGIGTALLLRSFREFYDRGERRVGLDVDTDSSAKRLYERVGMRVTGETVTYAKQLK